MLSKANKTKFGTILAVLAAGAFFTITGHSVSKTTPPVKSAAATPVQVKSPDSKVLPAANPADTASANATPIPSPTKAEQQAIAAKSDLNDYVLKVIHSYDGDKFPYLLNDDYQHYNGVTQNIVYKGSIIAKANPNGSRSSHCVGLTYEVFFKAIVARNIEAGLSPDNINNMTIDNMRDFMLIWYNALGTPKSEGDQLAGAIVKYGLGTRIARFEDAKAGDFIDFSRSQSGHTVVFINWLRDKPGNIVGFKYWSTQESTGGISYKNEYFSDNPQGAYKGAVNRQQMYIGRVGSIGNYRRFKV
ncbi:MAG: hypothetical protein Q8930_01280 [Bacillota bacterium]|nr:hypothetical protein [Bacillota bacterium]